MEIYLNSKKELEEVLNKTNDQTAFIIQFDNLKEMEETADEVSGK